MRIHPLWRANYWEMEAMLFGALLTALAFGSFFATSVKPLAEVMIVTGIPIHLWGTWRIYRRNPTPLKTIIGTPAAAAKR
jgi:hypothetical protein